MTDLVFNKQSDEYSVDIKIPSRVDDSISMTLDTGSPISIICVQNLIEITKEPRVVLLNKIDSALNSGNSVTFGVYGSQEKNQEEREDRIFVPYVLHNVVIGGQQLKLFLMWVDVTNYTTTKAITSTLFGFDYIKQGKKWFDEDDNFHISVEDNFGLDIKGCAKAISNVSKDLASINDINAIIQNKR